MRLGPRLLQLLKNYARNRNLKTAITVGIVGFPNVGKSSLINSLKRSRSAAAWATPGMTKVSKEIVLDKHVKLIDSPGVVFASSLGENAGVTALRNCVKGSAWRTTISPPCARFSAGARRSTLVLMYKVGKFENVDDFLRQVGRLQANSRRDMASRTCSPPRASSSTTGTAARFRTTPTHPSAATPRIRSTRWRRL